VLYELAEQSMNVGDLVDALGMPQSTVSRHLRILRDRQLVRSHREGTNMVYELEDRRVIDALNLLRAVLRHRLETRAQLADALLDES
jgi:ArsR family transcriptional regulator